MTVKAARVIGEADVVAYHSARHGRSIARGIAEPYLRPGQIEEHLVYPVTTETTDHPGGYDGAMEDFYAESAERIAAHLDAGRNVALLAEGDPLFYSSYMHMHTRLTARFDAVIVPGVTSVSAASAAIATPLVQGDEVLTDPARHPAARRAGAPAGRYRRRRDHEAGPLVSGCAAGAFVMPAGSTRRSTSSGPAPTTQRVLPAGEVRPTTRAVLLAGDGARQRGDADRRRWAASRWWAWGRATPEWMTPQSPPRAGGRDRPDRLRAVPGPGAGPRPGSSAIPATTPTNRPGPGWPVSWRGRANAVAVVSSGDPGVFAMATAVLEEAKQWPGVAVRVIPAMTAAQAVASRVGAPLGHDYAVVSLSDRLKPWEIIASRLKAAAEADLVLAIYNPASKTRTWQVAAMRDLLLEHRDPDTPVVIGRDVAGRRRVGAGGAVGRPGSCRGGHALPADRRVITDGVAAHR